MPISSEGRAEDEELVPFRVGDEGAGTVEPRHCAACEATLTVVTVVDFALASLLFWSAILRRFERFGLEVS